MLSSEDIRKMREEVEAQIAASTRLTEKLTQCLRNRGLSTDTCLGTAEGIAGFYLREHPDLDEATLIAATMAVIEYHDPSGVIRNAIERPIVISNEGIWEMKIDMRRIKTEHSAIIKRNAAWLVEQQAHTWWPPRFLRNRAARVKLEQLTTRFACRLK